MNRIELRIIKIQYKLFKKKKKFLNEDVKHEYMKMNAIN